MSGVYTRLDTVSSLVQFDCVGLRPESFAVAPNGGGLKLEVKLVEELGAYAYVYGLLPGDQPDERHFIVRFDGRVPPRIGDVLALDVREAEEHAFCPDSGQRLG